MNHPTPLKLSASAVRAYLECAYRYACDYVQRVPDDEREPVFNLAFGNVVHGVAATFMRRGGWGTQSRADLIHLLEARWVSEAQLQSARMQREFLRAAIMLERFFDARYPAGVRDELGVEKYAAWSRPHGGIIATGKLDRIVRLEDGGIEVIDLKTGKPQPPELVEQDLQVAFYRTIAADAYRLTPATAYKVSFHYLATGDVVSVQLERDELKERWKVVEATAGRIRHARQEVLEGRPLWAAFPLRVTAQCRGCPLRRHCEELKASVPELGAGHLPLGHVTLAPAKETASHADPSRASCNPAEGGGDADLL